MALMDKEIEYLSVVSFKRQYDMLRGKEIAYSQDSLHV